MYITINRKKEEEEGNLHTTCVTQVKCRVIVTKNMSFSKYTILSPSHLSKSTKLELFNLFLILNSGLLSSCSAS